MKQAFAYYNENDPAAAQWLRNLIEAKLIPHGYVDDRDIRNVRGSDVREFTAVHFFAGIGGWAEALRLAEWPADRSVWTGSCPCQPFSSAGGRKGFSDERHLWPEFRRLIDECRPTIVFGEQVDEARAWLDGVCDDVEALGYAVRARILPAYCAGADHARERIYFACYTDSQGQSGRDVNGQMAGLPGYDRFARGMVPPNGIPDRMACLRAFGNAIHPAVAAEFVKLFV